MKAAVSWPHGDPQTVVRAILRDPRFGERTSSTAPEPSLLDRIVMWFGDAIARVFRAIGHLLGADNPLNVLAGTVIIVLAAAGFAYAVYRLVRGVAHRRRGRAPADVGEPPAPERSAGALRAAAADAARAGNYREAAALLFLSAVRALDESGRLPYDPARTPGEYRRLVRDAAFDALAGTAVVAIFAPADPGPEHFARMQGAYDRFFAAMGA
ncbi:MAG: DUF4129 domain-containing protein [Candidatus Velthaea sp.]